MAAKRTRANLSLEDINSLFERLFSLIDTSNDDSVSFLNWLKAVKGRFLSEVAEEETRRQAESFTFDEAVEAFGLTYDDNHYLKIEEMPGFELVQPSECFKLFLNNYTRIYNRSSEAACRFGVDLLLCECIGLLQGRASTTLPTQTTEDGRTPTVWNFVRVHCEVSFSHPINHTPSYENIVVDGRVNHGVGIIIKGRRTFSRRFHSLLLCVEAKYEDRLSEAMSQLVVYLGSLRQSRVNRRRSDTSVYGIATDGLCYVFVTITHEGVIMRSDQFDLRHKNSLPIVLGCLKYVLESAMSMTPTSMLEKGVSKASEELQDDADDTFNLGDNPYMHPPNDEDQEF